MPKLTDSRKIIDVATETIEGGVIKVYDGLLAADVESLDELSGMQRTFSLLLRLIKEWNLEDEAGKPLPITLDNVKKLNLKEVLTIFSKVGITRDFLANLESQGGNS